MLISTLLQTRKVSANATYARIWNVFQEFAVGSRQELSHSSLWVQVSALSALTGKGGALDALIPRFWNFDPRCGFSVWKWDLPTGVRACLSDPFSSGFMVRMASEFVDDFFDNYCFGQAGVGVMCLFSDGTFYRNRVVLHPNRSFLLKLGSAFHLNWESVFSILNLMNSISWISVWPYKLTCFLCAVLSTKTLAKKCISCQDYMT